jgi:hypothetical protein
MDEAISRRPPASYNAYGRVRSQANPGGTCGELRGSDTRFDMDMSYARVVLL